MYLHRIHETPHHPQTFSLFFVVFFLQSITFVFQKRTMSDKEEMSSDGGLNVTLTLRLLMHGKVVQMFALILSLCLSFVLSAT